MNRLLSLAGLLLLSWAGAAAAQSAEQIPMRDFFRNPDRAYYRISGDGKTLSFMQPWERRMNIFIQPVGSSQDPVRITSEKDRDITDYFWKGANRVVYLKDVGGDENDHVVVVDRRGGEPRDVTPFPGVKAQVIDALVEFPNRMLIGLNKRVKEVFDAYELDLATGALTLVAENPGNITSWGADHTGRIRYAIATNGVENTYLYRATPTTPFKPVLQASAYGLAASRHFHEFGTTREQLAEIAVAARQWALKNPKAWEHDPLTVQDVLAARMVSHPLTVRDCCLVTDGGGALVVTSAERARSLRKPPAFVLGTGEGISHLTISNMPDLTVTAARESGAQASDSPA